MKRLFTVLFAVVAVGLQAAPFISIGDPKLYQAYAPSDSKAQLREYLPLGENFEHWNRLASVRVFKDLKNPKAYLLTAAAGVTKSHPAARYQFLVNDKTKELILDFMTFPPDSTKERFAEWNLMRAKVVEGVGLVVYQYAMRVYVIGKETGPIITAERKKMVGPFQEASFEEESAPHTADPTSAILP